MNPRLVMDSDGFLRDALLSADVVDPNLYCHRPIAVTDPAEKFDSVLARWSVQPSYPGDNVTGRDLVLYRNNSKKVITGADVLGRLLMGIAGRWPTGAASPNLTKLEMEYLPNPHSAGIQMYKIRRFVKTDSAESQICRCFAQNSRTYSRDTNVDCLTLHMQTVFGYAAGPVSQHGIRLWGAVSANYFVRCLDPEFALNEM
ncbi:MAG: hypothetical protein ACI915_003887 [Gammaproteobacteria bacterium]|jgi:hypothetical protein